MPTGTVATAAHRHALDLVHYIAKQVNYSDGAAAVVPIGTLPAGALVTRGGVAVVTAFNAATANVMDIGTAADDDGFGTDLALGTIGGIALDEIATSNDLYVSADTVVNATLALTGTAATAGSAYVWLEYIIANRVP